MSSSKSSKRTSTVEKSTQDSGTVKAKPSVFERLGAPHTYEKQDVCHDFANNGTCSYGSKCKYAHVKRDRDRERDRGSDHTERDRERDRGVSDDLRSRVSRKREETESEQETKKSGSQRKEKDGKIKSAVVITKPSDHIDDIWPEPFDADKGTVEREIKGARHQTSSSVHGTETDSHKWSAKSTSRLSDKNEEGIGQPLSSSKSKNKSPRSPSHVDDDSSGRLSRDKKKKKRHRSQETPSPDRVEDRQDQKHSKGASSSSKISSHKHSKSSSELKVRDTSSSSVAMGIDKKSKPQDIKDDNSKSVEKRLLMIAMETDSKQDSGRTGRVKSPVKSKRDSSPPPKGKDSRKDYSSPSARPKETRKDRVESPPSKSRKITREQSSSPVQSKENRRDRSASPSLAKEPSGRSGHRRSQNLPGPAVDNTSEKPKPLLDLKTFESSQKYDSRPQKPEKGKARHKRRRSSSSSASSSSSSSSGSDSGSSSGSSSSGSSSSSSSSSDMSSDGRKPTKDQRSKDAKVAGKRFDGKSGRPEDEKLAGKEGSRRRKDKERLPAEVSRGKRPADDKSKGIDTMMMMGKDDNLRSDTSPERSRKKGLDKTGQSVGSDSKKGPSSSSLDPDKSKRDDQHGSRISESLRQKHSDATEYSRKGRSSPLSKDDRNKTLTPVDTSSRHGLSPVESQRSHHSIKPVLPIAHQECDHEGQSSSGQYHDYYSSREKTVRKEDEHFQQHPEELYAKKHQDRGEPRGQSYSSHKQHPVDPYERTREAADHDREDRDGRYSRDHGFEAGRYPPSLDRRHADVPEDSRSRQEYYSSSYRDERRSGRMEESTRKDPERSEKHSSNHEPREPERDFDPRDHQKTRDQRPSDFREKTRGDGPEYSVSSSGGMFKKVEESRKDRTTQWVSEREPEDPSRQSGGRSADQRVYLDKRDVSRKRALEDDGGTGRSPSAKKMREGSPSESHHSFSSRATYERDYDKERGRSFRGRNVVREEDRYSSQTEGEFRAKGRDRLVDKEWEASRRSDPKDTKERSKDPKGLVQPRERGSESKEPWLREESSKRHRSPGDKLGLEGWERSKDWKHSSADLEAAERDKAIDRSLHRDEDHRGSPSRDRSPKSSGFGYKSERTGERTDGEREKRASDSLAFVKSIEADIESRTRLRSEEKRSLMSKDVEPSMIPVQVEDRMRRSQSRGSLGSKHSQRDREPPRRDDRQYEDRPDVGRDVHSRDDRLPPPERPYDFEDREAWIKDRGYDRIRPEDDLARPYRLPFDHDRVERDMTKSRDFEGDWEPEPFRRDSLGYRGLTRPPNWDRERPREEWESRYDRGPEAEYRARREVLLPPPPRPRPVPEVRVPSPLPPPPVETLVPPPVEHLPVRVEIQPEHVAPSKIPRPSKDEDTGYDDISDGELDDLIGVAEDDKEVKQVRKPGVIDILDIKWENLIQNNVVKPVVAQVVMSRFTASAIFHKIGVSRAFAGDDLLNQVKNFCQKQVDVESAEETGEQKEVEEQSSDLKVKEEIERSGVGEEATDGVSGALDPENNVEQQTCNNKTETTPKIETTPAKFELLDDLADFHAGLQLKSSERIGVVNNIGPYRRALCARRDLAIRRNLCKVDKEDILMFPTHVVDQDLYKQSLQLFHQDRTMEKKLPPSSSSHRLQALSATSA